MDLAERIRVSFSKQGLMNTLGASLGTILPGTVEIMVAPAVGERIIARGRVVKAGRTLTLVQTDVFAENRGREKLIALLTATMIDRRSRRHRRLTPAQLAIATRSLPIPKTIARAF
jgi:hypothetical protein